MVQFLEEVGISPDEVNYDEATPLTLLSKIWAN